MLDDFLTNNWVNFWCIIELILDEMFGPFLAHKWAKFLSNAQRISKKTAVLTLHILIKHFLLESFTTINELLNQH
jgi:hypothetical protein